MASLNPEVPRELDVIIDKALEKDRRFRYQRASDLRSDFQRLKRDHDSGGKAPAAAPELMRPLSLAVLPFANLSADKENEYFSDGLTEELQERALKQYTPSFNFAVIYQRTPNPALDFRFGVNFPCWTSPQ